MMLMWKHLVMDVFVVYNHNCLSEGIEVVRHILPAHGLCQWAGNQRIVVLYHGQNDAQVGYAT